MSHGSTSLGCGQSLFDPNGSVFKHAQASAVGAARRGRRRRSAQGLSTSHISPFLRKDRTIERCRYNLATDELLRVRHIGDSVPCQHLDGSAVIWDGLVTCKRPYSTSTNSKGAGGLRGRIRDFSKASRRNLLRTTARVQRGVLPLFLTLTYPGSFSSSPHQWKRDLSTWVKRLHRRYPDAGLIWRLEPQKRLAPHYHLLIWGISEHLRSFRAWVSESWYEVVGSEDIRHLQAGTRVEHIRSGRGVMFYAGKYLAKLPERVSPDGPDWSAGVGRWWGVRYPENIPWSNPTSVFLDAEVAHKLMDALLAYAGLPDGSWRSVTVFAVGAEWLGWLREMGVLVPDS